MLASLWAALTREKYVNKVKGEGRLGAVRLLASSAGSLGKLYSCK